MLKILEEKKKETLRLEQAKAEVFALTKQVTDILSILQIDR